MTTHRFNESRARSESVARDSFWEAAYRKFFGAAFVGMVKNADGNDAQRRGIDRLIFLSSGRSALVDEKARFTTYPDFLLEYVSVHRPGSPDRPGWIEQDLAIDYLAYAFVPARRVYLFPWLALRRAWVAHKQQWLDLAAADRDGFLMRDAKNEGAGGRYLTKNLIVPRQVLGNAIAGALRVDLPEAA